MIRIYSRTWYLGILGNVKRATRNAGTAITAGFGITGMTFRRAMARKYITAVLAAIPEIESKNSHFTIDVIVSIFPLA